MATMTEGPRRVESSLLVTEDFVDRDGFQWRAGDRASLARKAVREAARERRECFVIEFETLPFDPGDGWFKSIDAHYESAFAAIKRHRDGAEARRQAALRAELEEQNTPQPELEKRYRTQEKERSQRRERALANKERKEIEQELELAGLHSGFHFDR
jgi:hypothetical protein